MPKIDKFLFQDNIRRLCLIDMLRRKSYLSGITLEQLEDLTREINTLIGNLQYAFENSKMMIEVSDEHSSNSSLFRDIFTHTVMDIKPICEDSIKRMNEKLKERWRKEKNG